MSLLFPSSRSRCFIEHGLWAPSAKHCIPVLPRPSKANADTDGTVRERRDRTTRLRMLGFLDRTNAPTDGGSPESFVRHFRSAASYIALHRGCTFVVVLPGAIMLDKNVVVSLVDDIAMLHGMGIRLVLVLGAQPQIDRYLYQRGRKPAFASGYRITDEMSMEAAMEAAGSNRVLFEALLSKGPSVPMVRRHARSDTEFHYSAAMNVVSGNYVAARRIGVVSGTDYGYTGAVRFVHSQSIQSQLSTKNVVLLSNLGYSAGGELLNCNTFDVAVHAAIEIGAEKVICMHLEEVAALELPGWLSVTAARSLLQSLDPSFEGGRRRGGHPAYVDLTDGEEGSAARLLRAKGPGHDGAAVGGEQEGHSDLHGSVCEDSSIDTASVLDTQASGRLEDDKRTNGESLLRAVRITRGALKGQMVEMPPSEGSSSDDSEAVSSGTQVGVPRKGGRAGGMNEFRQVSGIPPAVVAAYEACRGGVTRAHLVDARLDGGLLLELYSRDGVGTMISADFYEGIRRAGPLDVASVQELLAPLEAAGIVVPRSVAQLTAEIDTFVVIEREARVLACAQLCALGASENGEFRHVAEIAAFCVHPEFRGTGRGDSLLDWTEQDARCRGFDLIVLLTTRTADWFQARDFVASGPAHLSLNLPVSRRRRVDPKRNSQLYFKKLEAPTPGMEPGTRIGF